MAPPASTVLELLLRAVNLVVLIIGLVLISFGLYLVVNYRGDLPEVEGSVIGLGVINCAFSGILIFFGYRSLFFLR